MEKIAQLGNELKTGFAALQQAQEKAAADTDAKIKGEVDKAANAIADQIIELQKSQGVLQAVLERVGGELESGHKGEDAETRAKREAFSDFLRKRGDTNLMTPDMVKAMSTDNLASGGYLVHTQMLGIIQTRVFETSPMRQVANVVKTNNKSVEIIIDDDEAGATWLGEGDVITETGTPSLGRLEIVAKKLAAYPRITNEMLADSSIDVEAWLAGKLSDKFGRAENTAFITGDGVSRPRGILNYPNWSVASQYQRGAIEQIANGSTTKVTEEGLIGLMGSLKEKYQARASFMMKRSTFVEILKLSGTNVFRFFNLQPHTGPQGTVLGPTLTLLEKPVYLADDMPVIATNALAIAYGDFSAAYTIIDRTAVSMMRDQVTAPGTTKFYSEKRTGGEVTNFEAIKLLRMSVS
ncbi:phage major capsid protein [Rhizobium pusense]|nr:MULTISPECIES: phage major capsid protein [Rhizobium/Agrobacterium group]MDH0908413.1 phage major capsid protein [Agrobacterium pusense]MDH1094245.1 phage major capsid protein [Agrobacterium pusense]MDH1110827.1 phage major capsid protein [Agrobacterium pusense]MDH2192169.1 phage major capsid protein [Agrobacterium pusense]CAD7043618.1 phage major capsid protein [Rhizobium sp. P007]